MNKQHTRITVLLCIVVILFAIGLTALHHHNLKDRHDCKICDFINTATAAILPAFLLLFVPEIIKTLIIILNKVQHSECSKAYSSRAPPFIPA
jgi:hypothetical protein